MLLSTILLGTDFILLNPQKLLIELKVATDEEVLLVTAIGERQTDKTEGLKALVVQ